MKKRYMIIAVTIMSLLATFATGCVNITKEGSADEGTGTLKLYLTDAPIDYESVEGVFITIVALQYNLDGEWMTAEEFEGPQSYNLLELSGGNSALLGEFELPAGYYSQIRFILDIPEQGSTPTTPGCYIAFTDDSEKPLFVPSGAETGYKAIGPFEVPVDGTAEVTADFDVQKAVAEAEEGGVYILKPVIRLVANDQMGNISGSIAGSSDYENITIYAYENATWTDKEVDEPSGLKSRFPGAIASGEMDENGNYYLALLEPGTYDLVVAGYNGGEFGEVLGFVSDVKVQKEQTAIRDIDIPLPAAPDEVIAFAGNKGVLLEWASNTEIDLAGYNVYCSTLSGGPYIKIAEVPLSKYNDKGLINGITYYYVVTALDASDNESVYSEVISATPTG